MTCVAAWLQTALGSDDARQMVVMDESWRMFSHLPIALWMQQSFKLSRASGTMNVMVMHRLSAPASAGGAGSHQVRLAEGLLADSGTRIIYGQPPSEVVRVGGSASSGRDGTRRSYRRDIGDRSPLSVEHALRYGDPRNGYLSGTSELGKRSCGRRMPPSACSSIRRVADRGAWTTSRSSAVRYDRTGVTLTSRTPGPSRMSDRVRHDPPGRRHEPR